MEGAISKVEKFNRQKLALASQASKVKQAVEYERSSDAGKKVKEQEGEVGELKSKLGKLEKQEAAGRQSRQAQEADLEEKVSAIAYPTDAVSALMGKAVTFAAGGRNLTYSEHSSHL